jgi:hypothetical protein
MEGVIFDATPHPAHAKYHKWDRSLLLENVSKLRTAIRSLSDVHDEIKNIVNSENTCFCTVQDFSLLKGKEYAYDETIMLCVCVCVRARLPVFPPFQLSDRFTDCHETWRRRRSFTPTGNRIPAVQPVVPRYTD